MRLRPTVRLFAAVLALTGAWGCRPPAEGPETPGERAGPGRVENLQVGVAVAALPSYFRVEANEGPRLELVPAAAGETGRLLIVAGEPETAGINLVEAIKAHKEEILARPGGEYKGQRELGSQLGTAFYSRGRYTGSGGATEEETVVFLVHPWGDRTLELVYRYPAGDGEETRRRIEDHLFAVLGELEPIEGGAAAAV
jgi:hypothetical protein